MEEIEAEMKLLNWHKLANEAALKAAIIRTKSLRAADSSMLCKDGPKAAAANALQDKAAWMAQVIEEEQRKPLQVRTNLPLIPRQARRVDGLGTCARRRRASVFF